MGKKTTVPEKGFLLCEGRYYYHPKTNTLINSELKEIYTRNCKNRQVKVENIKIDIDAVKSSLENLKQLIFEITQKCCIRCTYCAYESGTYYYNRSGSSKSLPIIRAEKVLEYIWKIVKKREKKGITIGFYGGEPLIEFDNIKRIVDFSRNLFDGWDLSYTITTNAILLNDRIIEYLIENNFLTFISLDGPRENHDAKRIFQDGSGSFRIVMEKIKRIKEISNDFFENNVTFSVVFSKDLSFEKMFNFFMEEELVKKSPINFGFVNELDTGYYGHHPYDPGKLREEREKIFSSVMKKKQNELSSIESNLLENHKIKEKILGKNRFTSLMGACFFDSRLYVDAEGRFHICERINDKFSFGNADKGFDYQKMVNLVTDYTRFLEKNCMKCDYNFLCQRCYIHFAKNGNFQMDNGFCESQKYSARRVLEELINMKELELKS